MTEFIPGNEYVTDTMGLILWMEKRRLNSAVKSIFKYAEEGNVVIYIPGIVFAEILYLSHRKAIYPLTHNG